MNFLNRIIPAIISMTAPADPNTATGPELQGSGSWLQMLVFIVPLVLMYVILIVPQKKKEKKQRETINKAIVGDEIVTIGGMVGKIVNIKDDDITFESSIERSKITIKRWAIKEVKKPIES
jgi:preprotein translocase subunit YajC